jgi:hypothetical protein
VSATIPSGIHRVSLYFLNKDGHGQHQIRRDYQIEVKQSDGDVDEAQGTPTLARARVMDFWGGVYHQFQLRGPGKFWFAIRRQASNVTTVSGVFIDRLTELTGDESTSAALPGMGEVVYEPPAIADNPQNTTSRVLKARQLWDALDSALAREGIATIEKPLRILAYRGAAAGGADDALLANWRWKLHMPNHEDRKRFDAVMKEAQPRK